MDRVPGIIDRLYDAVVDDAAWPVALAGICEAVAGHHAIAMLRDHSVGSTPFLQAVGVDPQQLLRFRARAAEIDPLIQCMPPGVTHHRAALLPDVQAVRMDFYSDVIQPMGGFRATLSVPLRRRDSAALLAVCRSRRYPDFSDDDAAFLDRILPHLARVLKARQSLDATRWAAAAVLEAVDRNDLLVAIVDAELRPVVLSHRAGAAVARADGLVLSGRRLAAAVGGETRLLRQLVRRLATENSRIAAPAAMRLTREPPAPDWVVRMHRLSAAAGGGATPLVALFLECPSELLPDLAGRLRTRFDLTPREAAVAAALARGEGLAAVARQLGIADGTARNYLKSVFLKTGTHRQAALVSLALRLSRLE